MHSAARALIPNLGKIKKQKPFLKSKYASWTHVTEPPDLDPLSDLL